MLCHVNNYFNDDNNDHINQQLSRCKDLFRWVKMKERVVSNQTRIDFKSCDRVIVKICVNYYHECSKQRWVALHDSEVQRKVSQDKVLAITEEASKG